MEILYLFPGGKSQVTTAAHKQTTQYGKESGNVNTSTNIKVKKEPPQVL